MINTAAGSSDDTLYSTLQHINEHNELTAAGMEEAMAQPEVGSMRNFLQGQAQAARDDAKWNAVTVHSQYVRWLLALPAVLLAAHKSAH